MPGLPYFYAARSKRLLPIRDRIGLVGLVMVLTAAAWLLAGSLPAQAIANTTATRVYGQGSSFTSGTSNNGGVSAASLSTPYGVAPDSSGGLYVVDSNNNRVLHYSGTSTTADRVYGQLGSFTSRTANNGGISAASLSTPTAVAADPNGGLYVADAYNNRVLHYSGTSTTADRVYGQGGSFTSGTQNTGGISAASLSIPFGIAVDPNGGIYVVDSNNNRALHYSGTSTTADRVYGQLGSFTSGTANNGGISATSLSGSEGIAVDPNGGLYIVDYNNHRVLHYSGTNTTADRVYGQLGSFTSNTANNGGVSAASLFAPTAVATDGSGGIYVADFFNNRALHYSGTSTTADRVYGQAGSFTSGTANKGGISAASLYAPNGLAVDGSGGLYVVDRNNNRVLYYGPSVPASVSVLAGSGQSTTVGTAFSTRLVANVVDSYNSPVSGTVVTFTAPTSGASGRFTGGSAVYTGTTDASGLVTATTFTANTLAGSYNLTASVSGVITPATFALTNTAGLGDNMAILSGNNQSATVNTAFSSPLVVSVTDQYNNPVSGKIVTFVAPSGGASATFAGGATTVTATTGANGRATSPALTANSLIGTYTAIASASGRNGSLSANFTLTNVAECSPLVVTSTGDDGSCGTLRYAVLNSSLPLTSKAKIITLDLPAGSVITLTTGMTLTSGVSITTTASCGVGTGNTMLPPVTIQGAGASSGNGLTLSGNNRLYGLWVRGFSGVQIKALPGSATLMQCVKASKL